MRTKAIVIALAAMAAGCATPVLQPDRSADKSIDSVMQSAADAARSAGRQPVTAPALPPGVSQSLLPPLRASLPRAAAANEPRFNLAVTDAPVSEVLHAVADDTRYSILLSPKLQTPSSPPSAAVAGQPVATAPRERITVNLKNVTVFEALDALRETYGYEYTVQGTRIFVQPPELQTRFYQVNYTLGQRRGVSDLQVFSGAAAGGGGNGGSSSGSNSGGSSGGNSNSNGSGGGAASYGSTQASALSTISKSDLWGEIEDSLRTILGCQIPRLQAPVSRSTSQGSSGTGTSSRADVSFYGEANLGERPRGVDGCTDGRAVHVNPMSGTVLVRGLPREMRTVEKLLRAMQVNVERQVIIEAKVIDVRLNKNAQQGINWAAFNKGLLRGGVGPDPSTISAQTLQRNADGSSTVLDGGVVRPGASLADLLGTTLVGGGAQTAFAAGLGIILRSSQFAALINFLETQGDVHVLSSPRIATLNNQKAVIKVGVEEPFVTAISPGSTSLTTGASVSVAPTLTYQPFFSGISLDVTAQIDENDRVTLHAHAMVNSITEKEKPSSTLPGTAPVPLAVSSVNETDSVVKTGDGMMVVIGGLMTESSGMDRSQVPWLGDVPLAGALFRKGDQSSGKRELVILIKPTVVRNEGDWAEDLAMSGQRIRELQGRREAPTGP
jgi:MSHA biogenesis protein MshL